MVHGSRNDTYSMIIDYIFPLLVVAVLKSTYNVCFRAQIRKIMYAHIFYIKWSFSGRSLHILVKVMYNVYDFRMGPSCKWDCL